MKGSLSVAIGLCISGSAGSAVAGGLLLPGAGVVSTSRAGAAVASADDAEAITLNPAGIAKSHGTVITIGAVAIDYAMSFARAGDYPASPDEPTPYAGTPYPKVSNTAKPPLGLGSYQPVPLIGIVSDLNGLVPKLHVGFSVYAPNAYPFRNMNTVNGQPYYTKESNGSYNFPSNTTTAGPPPSRYDIVEQEAAIILPSIAVAYNVLPNLDVGGRFSAGYASLKSSVAVWPLANYEERSDQDGIITINAHESFVTTYGFGANYRPLPNLELAAQWSAPINIHAKGDVYAYNGSQVMLGGQPVTVTPVDPADAKCEQGGTVADLKGCVDIEIPMTATIAGRWKFLDPDTKKMRGDIELDLGWEHWGAKCNYISDPNCLDPSDYHVEVDAMAGSPLAPGVGQRLQPQLIEHNLRDTYSARLGGSWIFPVGKAGNTVVVRGGVGYDSAAANTGWERSDLDGEARTTFAVGGSYKWTRISLDAGFSYIYEGSLTQNRNCVPLNPEQGCGSNGAPDGVGTKPRQGPDPTDPVLQPSLQFEYPVNEGTYDSHYVMFMLGASTWF